jgi:hypothetical protein
MASEPKAGKGQDKKPAPYVIPQGRTVDTLDPVCPFTGKPVEVKKLGNGKFMAVGPFWTSNLFDEKQPLMYRLFTRRGVAPAFDEYPERIQLREREPVDDGRRHIEDDLRRDKLVEGNVGEYIDRNLKGSDLKK